ncbi:MAG: hypothetical protein KDA86_22205 [Planctomycetaceae bacterium]|nr:hypothetical protein [Planctomycetaceae bacterium]
MGVRESVLDALEMLAQPSAQLQYEKSLVHSGHAPTELVSVFCDDLFNPKNETFTSAFSADELKGLAHLYGLLVETADSNFPDVTAMLKDPTWRRVVDVAQQLRGRMADAR